MIASDSQTRILHVVGGMPRHGSETWLMHVLRNIDRQQFQMDFLVHTLEPHAYDDEIRALGSRVIPCLHPSKPRLYAKHFKQVLQEYGTYNIVHSHVHHYSGFVLRLAHEANIQTRIAHSHSDTIQQQAKAKVLRKAYFRLMRTWISRYATVGLAASQAAASALFGSTWQTDPRWQVLHCGIDLSPFKIVVDSSALRAELGISTDAFVIGHVGRFCEPKNHTFLIEIFAEVVKKESNSYLLLVGDGILRPEIERKINQLGLSDQVIFAGIRSDVHQLMIGVMDVFLFPSLYEGLGLALIEAQAAGLPCIFSDVVPKEADIARDLLCRVSLSQKAVVWANAIISRQNSNKKVDKSDVVESLKNSKFNIKKSIKELQKAYILSNKSVSSNPEITTI